MDRGDRRGPARLVVMIEQCFRIDVFWPIDMGDREPYVLHSNRKGQPRPKTPEKSPAFSWCRLKTLIELRYKQSAETDPGLPEKG
jgi:hypothetical protein